MSNKSATIVSYSLKDFNELSDATKAILMNMRSVLKIKYSDPEFPTLQCNEKGDWIDLKCTEDYTLKAGEFALIDLGVAMKLPNEYEAWLAPRSGTFKKYGLIQTNSIGIIDNSYSGNNDIWHMPVYATRDTEIKKGERLCQFRLVKRMSCTFAEDAMPTSMYGGSINSILHIIEVDQLDDTDRGGFGSTGR